jgi:hypothetical protein
VYILNFLKKCRLITLNFWKSFEKIVAEIFFLLLKNCRIVIFGISFFYKCCVNSIVWNLKMIL